MEQNGGVIQTQCQEMVAALNTGALDRYIELLAPDVVWIRSGQSALAGKQAIREWLAPSFELFNYQFSVSEDWVRVSGAWAIQRATFTTKVSPKKGGEPTLWSAKQTVIWRLEFDGAWYIERCIDDNDRSSQRPAH